MSGWVGKRFSKPQVDFRQPVISRTISWEKVLKTPSRLQNLVVSVMDALGKGSQNPKQTSTTQSNQQKQVGKRFSKPQVDFFHCNNHCNSGWEKVLKTPSRLPSEQDSVYIGLGKGSQNPKQTSPLASLCHRWVGKRFSKPQVDFQGLYTVRLTGWEKVLKTPSRLLFVIVHRLPGWEKVLKTPSRLHHVPVVATVRLGKGSQNPKQTS